MIPLYEVPVSVRVPGEVASVVAVGDTALPFTVAGDRINFTVPEVMGHQMVEINFA